MERHSVVRTERSCASGTVAIAFSNSVVDGHDEFRLTGDVRSMNVGAIVWS